MKKKKKKYLESSTRVDIVWDVLQTNRQKMGKGVRRTVVLSALILKNWKDFLYVWTRTRQNCLHSCKIRSPFKKR